MAATKNPLYAMRISFCLDLSKPQMLRLRKLNYFDVRKVCQDVDSPLIVDDIQYGDHFGTGFFFRVQVGQDGLAGTVVREAENVKHRVLGLLRTRRSRVLPNAGDE